MNVIDRFDGAYRFLSNFLITGVSLDGVVYPSVEHAYQAAKTIDGSERNRIRQTMQAGRAKRLGRSVTMRPDWDDVKLQIMANLLVQKFAPGTPLAHALDETGDAYLIEGNTWGDTFWGVCNGVGQNFLGELLMKIRESNRYPRGRVCECRRGYVSRYDGKCGHCRTRKEQRAHSRMIR